MNKSISIYKYHPINNHLYDLILNHEIWFSNPNSFNDPYDCNIHIKPLKSKEELYRALKKINKGKEIDKDTVNKIENADESKLNTFYDTLQNSSFFINRVLGISCFSYNFDNTLMWSHYTNNHKGVCLRFEPKYDKEFFRLSLDVQYTKKYPIIDLVKDNPIVVLSKLSRYKHINWKYEDEIRIGSFDGSGIKKFKPNFLREIILGCCCSQKDIDSIIKLVIKTGQFHISFSKMEMTQGSFQLKKIEIEKPNIESKSREIDKETSDFVLNEMKVLKNDTLNEVNKRLDTEFQGRYLELIEDVFNVLIRLNKKEQKEFLSHFPKNKEILDNLLSHHNRLHK